MGSSQKRAIENYRARLGERGLARFEALGRHADRDLIRALTDNEKDFAGLKIVNPVRM